MIKIVFSDNSVRWVSVHAIEQISAVGENRCTVYLRADGAAFNAPYDADDLAKRVKRELRDIHQTPDYKE